MTPVLFTRTDSPYLALGCDCYDIKRDARTWPGGRAAVFHPPCRAWGRLSHFAKPRPDEMDLARWSVRMVRRFGGVIEHPSASRLWTDQALPQPGSTDRDVYGGWTLPIEQHWFGHMARKRTWLYIVGIEPGELPPISFSLDLPQLVNVKHAGPSIREGTPPAFAAFLLSIAEAVHVL